MNVRIPHFRLPRASKRLGRALLALGVLAALFVATGATANSDPVPIAGDWNGDGRTTVGWYSNGEVLLRYASFSGSADVRFEFGDAGDVPVVGDWNGDGRDSLGVIRDGTWHLRFENAGGPADLSFVFGRISAGDHAVAGDWNGDGQIGVGVVRNGRWSLRNSLSGGSPDIVFRYGRAHEDDVPVVGDWNGDGIDTPAIVRNGDWHIRYVNRGGDADQVFAYGRTNDLPLSGDWNRNGQDGPGVVRGAQWHLCDTLRSGAADHNFQFSPAAGRDLPSRDSSRDSSGGQDHADGGHRADGGNGHGHGDEGDEDGNDHDGLGSASTMGHWNDASTWQGGVPTADDDVTIDGHVVVDGEATAKTVMVTPGSILEFAPSVTSSLQVSGNIVIEGTLRMRPSGAGVEHTLQFLDIDEESFVGSGHEVLDSDVGLWVTAHGTADIEGSDRLAWTRSATSLLEGSTKVELEDVPSGWRKDDEILITPTNPPGTSGHSTGYSEGRITAISGRTIYLDTPLSFDHPQVAGKWGAEVMNMTRNVRIEGTPAGRAHVIFAHTHSPQSIRNAGLRYMGPRQETGDTYTSGGERHSNTEGVLGRYPLHFHHSGAGSAGSVVEDVVVRDSGNRAFVAHASDGVTFSGTIAHDVFEAAYWWDGTVGGECCGRNWIWDPPSNHISYHRAIASLIHSDPSFRGFNLAGFELGHGSDLSITDSVAVGVQGNKNSSGFFWPGPNSETENAWRFQDNVSHNNRVHGIHVWANTGEHHLVESSVLYHNGENGIGHGAYTNRYKFTGLTLYGNGRSGVDLHAQGEIHFADLVFDGGGISRFGFTTGRHRQDRPGVLLLNPTFTGYTEHGVSFNSTDVSHLDVVNPTFSGPEGTWFHLHEDAHPESVIRVQLSNGEAFRLYPASSDTGTLVPAWNARKATIEPFA